MANRQEMTQMAQQNRSLLIRDTQVVDLMEELASYLEWKLSQFDAARPNSHYLTRWDAMVLYAGQFIAEQPTMRELRARRQ